MTDEIVDNYENLLPLYERFEPYHYMQSYLEAFKVYVKTPRGMLEAINNPRKYSVELNFQAMMNEGLGCPDARIIQLDKEMIPLLEDTDPDFDDLHLPYPAMFINHQFRIGKFWINGFMMVDLKALEARGSEIDWRGMHNEKLWIVAIVMNTEDKYEFFSVEPLAKKLEWVDGKTRFFDNDKERAEMSYASQLIGKVGANLIELIINNEREIKTFTQKADPEQNKKRIKRGKMPHRDKLVIQLGDRLRAYAVAYGKKRGEIDIRFLVRGHRFHFRNVSKYHGLYERFAEAESQGKKLTALRKLGKDIVEIAYSKNDQGIISIWKLPFYKNENIEAYDANNRLVEIKKGGKRE